MNIDYRYIVKAGAIGVLTTLLVSSVQQLIQALADLKVVKKTEVKSI
jgi:hypothetical protein